MLKFSKILYPVDLERPHKEIISNALNMVYNDEIQLHVLFVNNAQAGYRTPHLSVDDVREKIRELVPDFNIDASNIIISVAQGDVGDEVESYTESNGIELIVTGHHHHGKLLSALFHSPDEDIVERASVPVLVIPFDAD